MPQPATKLTSAQRQALDYAAADGELQIGGMDGRPVRRDVAERLVDMGLLVCVHTPDPFEQWLGYRASSKPESVISE